MLPVNSAAGQSTLRLVVHFCRRKFVVVVPSSATFGDLKGEIARVYVGIAPSPSNTSPPAVAELQDGYGCVLFDGYSVGSVLRDLQEVYAFTADERELTQDSCSLPGLVPPLRGSPQKPWTYGSGMLYPFQGLWPFTGFTPPPSLPLIPSQFMTQPGPVQVDSTAATPSSISVGSLTSELPPAQTPANLQYPAVPDNRLTVTEQQLSPTQHGSMAVAQNIQRMFEAAVSDGSTTTALHNQEQQILATAATGIAHTQPSVASDSNQSVQADISLPASHHPLATVDETSVRPVGTHAVGSRTVSPPLLVAQGSGPPQADLSTADRNADTQAEGSSTSETAASRSYVAMKRPSQALASPAGAVSTAHQNVTCLTKESESLSEEVQEAVNDSRNYSEESAVGHSGESQPVVRRLEFANDGSSSSSDSEMGLGSETEQDKSGQTLSKATATSSSFENSSAKSQATAFKLAKPLEKKDSQTLRPLEQPSGEPSREEGSAGTVTAPNKPELTALGDSGSDSESDEDETAHSSSADKHRHEQIGDRPPQVTTRAMARRNVRQASVMSGIKTRLQLQGGKWKETKGKPPIRRGQTLTSVGEMKSPVGNRQESPEFEITEEAIISADSSLVVEEADLVSKWAEQVIVREENSMFVPTEHNGNHQLQPTSVAPGQAKSSDSKDAEIPNSSGRSSDEDSSHGLADKKQKLSRSVKRANRVPPSSRRGSVRRSVNSTTKSKPASKAKLSTSPRKGKSRNVRGRKAKLKTQTGSSDIDTISTKVDGKTSAVSKRARLPAIRISPIPQLSSFHSTDAESSTGSGHIAVSRKATRVQAVIAELSSSDWSSSDEECAAAAVKEQVKSRSSSKKVETQSRSQTLKSSHRSSYSNAKGGTATKKPKQSHSGSKTNETHSQSTADRPGSSKKQQILKVEVQKPSKQVTQKLATDKPAILAKQTGTDDSSSSSSDSDDEEEDIAPEVHQPQADIMTTASIEPSTAINDESKKRSTQPEPHTGKSRGHVRPVQGQGSARQTVDSSLSNNDDSDSSDEEIYRGVPNLLGGETRDAQKDARVGSTALPYKGSHVDSDTSDSDSDTGLKDRTQPDATTSRSKDSVRATKPGGVASSAAADSGHRQEPNDVNNSTSFGILSDKNPASEIPQVAIPDIGEEITVLSPPSEKQKLNSALESADSGSERTSGSRETGKGDEIGRQTPLGNQREKPDSSESSEESSSEEEEASTPQRSSILKATLGQSDRGNALAKSTPSGLSILTSSKATLGRSDRGKALAKSTPSGLSILTSSKATLDRVYLLAKNTSSGLQRSSVATSPKSTVEESDWGNVLTKSTPSVNVDRPLDPRSDQAPDDSDSRQSSDEKTHSQLTAPRSDIGVSRELPSLHGNVRKNSRDDASSSSEELLALETQSMEEGGDVTAVPDTHPMEIDCSQDGVNVIPETQEEEDSERPESPEIPLLGLLARKVSAHVVQRDREPALMGDGDRKQKKEGRTKIEVIDLTTPEPPDELGETNAVAEVTEKSSRRGERLKTATRKKKLKSTHISVLDGSEEVQLGENWIKKKKKKLKVRRGQFGRKDSSKEGRHALSGCISERTVPVLKAATSESDLSVSLEKSERSSEEDQAVNGTASESRERKKGGKKSKMKLTKAKKIEKSSKKSLIIQDTETIPLAAGLTAKSVTHSNRVKAQPASEEVNRSKLKGVHHQKPRVEESSLSPQEVLELRKPAFILPRAAGLSNSANSKRIPTVPSENVTPLALDADQSFTERSKRTATSSSASASERAKIQAATTATTSVRMKPTADDTGSLRRTLGPSLTTKAVTATESSDSSSSSEDGDHPGAEETPPQRRSSASFAALLGDSRKRKDLHGSTSSTHKSATLLDRHPSSSSASRHRFSSEASMRLFSLSHTVHPLKRKRPAGSAVTSTHRRKKHKSGESKTEELNLSTLSQEEVEYSRTASQKLSELLDDELLWDSKT